MAGWAYRIARVTGLHRVVRWRYGGCGSIFLLHRVVPVLPPSPLTLTRCLATTPAYLRTLLAGLRTDGYEFIPLSAVPARLAAGPHSRRFACFTCDDGYRDNLTHALPLFAAEGVPFTVYVTTGYPDRQCYPWWHVVEEVLRRGQPVQFTCRDQSYTLATATPADQQHASAVIGDLLFGLDWPAQDRLVSALARGGGLDPWQSLSLMLDWPALQRLAQHPLVTVGAHSLTHPRLSALSLDAARREIVGSRQRVQAMVGQCDHFAFPYGGPAAVGRREGELVAAAGFATATTTRMSNVFPAHAGACHRLPRLLVQEQVEDLAHFRVVQLSGLAAATAAPGHCEAVP